MVYVDDLILTGSSERLLHGLITQLGRSVTLKDLGSLTYFLGVEVSWLSDGLQLTQSKYIKDLLHRANMQDASSVSTPSTPQIDLTGMTSDAFDDPTLYRQIVGGLQYLALTRPDVSMAVNKTAQYMHSPSIHHWQAVKRILRYLRGTVDHGLVLRYSSTAPLIAYSDADWGGDKTDRNSTSAYIVFHGSNPISWVSRKQKTVARSSTDSEYRALAAAASEVYWLQCLLRELNSTIPTIPRVWCDNVSATYLAANPVFHSRSKHLELDFHFVRDQVRQKNLIVSYISTVDQLADALTKPLSKARFLLMRDKLMVHSPIGLRGGVEQLTKSK